MGQREVNAAMNRILLRTRAALLRDFVSRERKLDAEYGAALERLQLRLRNTPPGKVPKAIRDELAKLVKKVAPHIEHGIEQGTIKGDAAARQQYESLFDRSSARAGFQTGAQSMALAGKRIRGAVYVDKFPLSRRLWNNHQKLAKKMGAEIQGAIRAGESMTGIADRIIGYTDQHWISNPPKLQMPKYIEELTDAAKRATELGQPNILQDAVGDYSKQVNKLGQSSKGFASSVRPASKQFIKDIAGKTPEQIDKIAERWMIDKARYHARMIARTETVEAYRDSYRESVKDKPWTQGMKWNLSPSHPHADICDVLASQDNYGLGAGGYPADEVPDTPHPMDMCYQTAIMDQNHFQRELAKRKGEKPPPTPWKSKGKTTAHDWLKKQSEEKRVQILGRKRAKLFKQEPENAISPKGKMKAVRRRKKT